MTKGPIKNMAASVRQRLMTFAKNANRPFSEVLQYYALERWLFRLSQSEYRDRLILKGALLFVVWKAPATRPTRDIDLLGSMSNDLESVRASIAQICQTTVDDDGLEFNASAIATSRIAEDAMYEGARATFPAKLGNARVAMQIDIGFSDVVTPGPARVSYPTLLEQPAPELLAYNRETAIAEKFEAMVSLGELNSRMKDFFDIATLAASFAFDGASLAAAIRATFDRRNTEVRADPVCFSDRFANDAAKSAQWKAFVRRSLLADAPTEFPEVVRHVREFLLPVATRMESKLAFEQHWPRGGPGWS